MSVASLAGPISERVVKPVALQKSNKDCSSTNRINVVNNTYTIVTIISATTKIGPPVEQIELLIAN